MTKKLLILAIAFVTLAATAEVQKGVVKTKGYPNEKGSRVAGASVKLSNANETTSDKNGSFEVKINGTTFRLESVRDKDGKYELSDKDACRYTYKCPVDNFTIVLEKPAEKLEHRDKYTEQILSSRDKEIKKLKAENKRLRDEGKISEKKYKETLQELIKFQTKDLSSIIDEYMKIDWDAISDFNRELNTLILNGEIMQADSLLRTQGDVTQLDKKAEDLIHFKEQINKTINESIEDIAERYYNWHRVYLERFKTDSAAYCLERRALLDTTNCEWLNDAGDFKSYQAQYSKALLYYYLALRQARSQYGEESYWVARCYRNIGVTYQQFGDKDDLALEYYKKSLDIRLKILNENDPDVALLFLDIGDLYLSMANSYYVGDEDPFGASEYYEKSWDNLENAKRIWEQCLEKNHPNLASLYIGIGMHFFYRPGDDESKDTDYVTALEYYEKAKTILLSNYKEDDLHMIPCYIDIAGIYYQENNTIALDYCLKALAIELKFYGETDPDVARSYGRLAQIYIDMGDVDNALKYEYKALEILLQISDEESFEVKETFINIYNIGEQYFVDEEYPKALVCYEKVLSICKQYLPKGSKSITTWTEIIDEVNSDIP